MIGEKVVGWEVEVKICVINLGTKTSRTWYVRLILSSLLPRTVGDPTAWFKDQCITNEFGQQCEPATALVAVDGFALTYLMPRHDLTNPDKK